MCAKPNIKRFFTNQGKQKSKEKYGLISYLERQFKKLYSELEENNTLNYQKVKYVKGKIDELKGQILEGVQIRSKVQEIKYGEMPSSFLVGKLKAEGTKKTIYKLKAEQSCGHINLNEEINKTDDINKYVHSYFLIYINTNKMI